MGICVCSVYVLAWVWVWVCCVPPSRTQPVGPGHAGTRQVDWTYQACIVLEKEGQQPIESINPPVKVPTPKPEHVNKT